MYVDIIKQGVTYNLEDYAQVIGIDGLGVPDLTRFLSQSANVHGARDHGFRLGPRFITLYLEVIGTSEADLFTKRTALLGLLKPSTTPVTLAFYTGSTILGSCQAYMISDGKLGTSDKHGFTQRGSFVFEAPDPILWKSRGASVVTITPWVTEYGRTNVPAKVPWGVGYGTGPHLQTTTTDNTGNWTAVPTLLRVYGPITDPTVRNDTTGEALVFSGVTVTDGNYLDIDVTPEGQTVLDKFGTSMLNYLSESSDLATFHLEPGTNTLVLVGSGIGPNTKLEIDYYFNFIGL